MRKVLIMFSLYNSHVVWAATSSVDVRLQEKPLHCHHFLAKHIFFAVFQDIARGFILFHGQGVGALYIVMDALKRRRAEEKEKEEK